MAHRRMVSQALFPPSISFSGAGFLGCYHVGVTGCLVKHGYLLPPGEAPTSTLASPPMLLGASAGSINCAGVMAGVSSEDAMEVVLKLAQITRNEGGYMDAFRPG